MSLILAGCVLVLALLISIIIDYSDAKDWQDARRFVPFFDAW